MKYERIQQQRRQQKFCLNINSINCIYKIVETSYKRNIYIYIYNEKQKKGWFKTTLIVKYKIFSDYIWIGLFYYSHIYLWLQTQLKNNTTNSH